MRGKGVKSANPTMWGIERMATMREGGASRGHSCGTTIGAVREWKGKGAGAEVGEQSARSGRP
jgi:hypothetical protein